MKWGKKHKLTTKKHLIIQHREKLHYHNKLIEYQLYPIDRSRNGGAKPRNIEVSRDKSPFSENNGRTIEKPIIKK